jgi:hypothetical protein
MQVGQYTFVPQPSWVKISNVNTVQEDCALRSIVEPLNQVCNRRLACTRGTTERGGFPSLEFETKAIQYVLTTRGSQQFSAGERA